MLNKERWKEEKAKPSLSFSQPLVTHTWVHVLPRAMKKTKRTNGVLSPKFFPRPLPSLTRALCVTKGSEKKNGGPRPCILLHYALNCFINPFLMSQDILQLRKWLFTDDQPHASEKKQLDLWLKQRCHWPL